MTLKELLKKKERLHPGGGETSSHLAPPDVPEFTFLRTTTNSQELIAPPSFPGDRNTRPRSVSSVSAKRISNPFRKSADTLDVGAAAAGGGGPRSPKNERRLSERFGLHTRTRSATTGSANVPADLPDIGGRFAARSVEDQEEWERRATLLAKGSQLSRRGSAVSVASNAGSTKRPEAARQDVEIKVVGEQGDENIQEAIRLHESGDLERSTALFGRLADPEGANNALSQVLYGLALRHGWGCAPDLDRAVTYLSHAASNSADIEALALQAGMKKGGAAKGELVLAIFELANCFRNGWGVKRDPFAAKHYYETAANLGDTDAMNEIAWCYLEGFGCKKDKFKAAQYLRLAEENGHKVLGNSCDAKEQTIGGERSICVVDRAPGTSTPGLGSPRVQLSPSDHKNAT